MTQQPSEDPQAFLMRALTIRQKIIYASKECDSGIKYDASSVQSLFLHALETGLRDETIRAKIRPSTSNTDVSDEQLIEAMFLAVSAETERSNKFNHNNPLSKGQGAKARISMYRVTTTLVRTKRFWLHAIKQVRTELSAVQSQVKTLRDCVNQKNELSKDEARKAPPTTNQAKCDKCKNPEECDHCFLCGDTNHIARYCRSRSKKFPENGRRLPPRDRE